MVFLFFRPEVEKFHFEIYENIFSEKYENIFQGNFFCFWGLGAGNRQSPQKTRALSTIRRICCL